MASTIGVPEARRKDVEQFVRSHGVGLEVVEQGTGDVNAVESTERREGSMAALYAGGWVRCHVALALAHRLNVGSRDMGDMLDLLEIKIRDCSLGCFK